MTEKEINILIAFLLDKCQNNDELLQKIDSFFLGTAKYLQEPKNSYDYLFIQILQGGQVNEEQMKNIAVNIQNFKDIENQIKNLTDIFNLSSIHNNLDIESIIDIKNKFNNLLS